MNERNCQTTNRDRHRPSRGPACHKLSVLGLVGCLVLSAGAQETPASPNQPGSQLKTSDALADLNAAFRKAYAASRLQVIQQNSPVIIHAGDTMMLIKEGVRTEAPTITPRYHELKAVAHVPLALFVMLRSGADSKLDDSTLDGLRAYRSLVVSGRQAMEARGFTGDQLKRQLRIFDRSLNLVDTTLREGLITQADLRRFTQNQKEDILANTYEAAEDQIETMDRQVRAWLAAMTDDERKRLRVAVSSVHMARVGNLAMQYFSVVLDEPYEGRFEEEEIKDSDFRLLFTESVFDEKEILKAIGTHIVDAEVGASFFNDPQRMHRDLLSDATEDILLKKFARKPSARRSAPAR